jgi:two-component system, OmpR family, sensor histidine kinase SenX3
MTANRRLEAALTRLGVASAGASAADIDKLAAALESVADDMAGRLERCDTQIGRLQASLDHVAEGVVICDAEGREVYRNDAAGSHAGGRMGGAVAAGAIAEHLATARQGHPVERVLELFSPTRRVLSVRSFPIARGDGGIGAVAIIEDVSERRRVDAIRRDFVANVSHELKTPVGALSLLAETLDGEEDAAVVARLSGRLAMEAERLGHIIDDLLDLSRIEANEAPTRELIPVQTILGQAMETLRPMAEARGISLEAGDADRSLALLGDRWELVSAVANLVDNALKYSEPGGRVEVQARAATSESDGSPTVEIAVSDRGIGIPKRDLERIFERFYRVDRARSRSTGGTGLGLSIVRHVVANHHGSVRVESTEGVGSTFTLVLPRPGSGQAEPSLDPQEPPNA